MQTSRAPWRLEKALKKPPGMDALAAKKGLYQIIQKS
jgi:hypothetical protein